MLPNDPLADNRDQADQEELRRLSVEEPAQESMAISDDSGSQIVAAGLIDGLTTVGPSADDSMSQWNIARSVRAAIEAAERSDAAASENSTLEQQSNDIDRGNISLAATSESPTELVTVAVPPLALSAAATAPAQPVKPLILSTLMSLMVVLVLLVSVRLVVPPLVENTRYAWYRGQLRAEHDVAGEFLRDASLGNMAEVSPLVSMRVAPSVVHVNLRQTIPAESASLSDLLTQKWAGGIDGPLGDGFIVGQGSGVIIDDQGYIITNHHVIEDGEGIEVTLSDGRRAKANIVAIDSVTDLAVLKIDLPDLIPIQWGDSDRVSVGSPVWAVGSPYGLSNSITLGILSGKHRADLRGTRYEQSVRGDARYGDLMQSDVAVNPGNSGGPLVDSQGRVIGINTAILGESYRGVSFAIPSNVARVVADRLIRKGEMARGWLGVSLQDSLAANLFDEAGRPIRGAFVQGLVKDLPSPGREAGLVPGDIIVNYNQKTVSDHHNLIRMIGETEVGTTVPMKVRRGDDVLDLEVTIAARPKDLLAR